MMIMLMRILVFIFQNSLAEEDEDSIKTHLTLLQQEMRKATPDLQLCQRKLERTFSYRQRLKYDPKVSVGDILSEFPVLRHRNFVSIFFTFMCLNLFSFHYCEFYSVIFILSAAWNCIYKICIIAQLQIIEGIEYWLYLLIRHEFLANLALLKIKWYDIAFI